MENHNKAKIFCAYLTKYKRDFIFNKEYINSNKFRFNKRK